MKQYLKFLMLLVLSLALIAGINSCGKESSGGIEPTPVNPTPNNNKPTPEPGQPDKTVGQKLYDEAFVIIKESKDYDKAVEKLKQAAEANVDSANLTLAYMYEYGIGVKQDIEKAKVYYAKEATLNNNEFALEKVASLNDNGTNYKIVLPEKSNVQTNEILLICGDTISMANGDGSFKTSSSIVVAKNPDNKLVGICYRHPNSTGTIKIDALESALTLMSFSVPYLFEMDEKANKVIREELLSLEETHLLAKEIEKQLVENGGFDYISLVPLIEKGCNAIYETYWNVEMPKSKNAVVEQGVLAGDGSLYSLSNSIQLSPSYTQDVKTTFKAGTYNSEKGSWDVTVNVKNMSSLPFLAVYGTRDESGFHEKDFWSTFRFIDCNADVADVGGSITGFFRNNLNYLKCVWNVIYNDEYGEYQGKNIWDHYVVGGIHDWISISGLAQKSYREEHMSVDSDIDLTIETVRDRLRYYYPFCGKTDNDICVDAYYIVFNLAIPIYETVTSIKELGELQKKVDELDANTKKSLKIKSTGDVFIDAAKSMAKDQKWREQLNVVINTIADKDKSIWTSDRRVLEDFLTQSYFTILESVLDGLCSNYSKVTEYFGNKGAAAGGKIVKTGLKQAGKISEKVSDNGWSEDRIVDIVAGVEKMTVDQFVTEVKAILTTADITNNILGIAVGLFDRFLAHYESFEVMFLYDMPLKISFEPISEVISGQSSLFTATTNKASTISIFANDILVAKKENVFSLDFDLAELPSNTLYTIKVHADFQTEESGEICQFDQAEFICNVLSAPIVITLDLPDLPAYQNDELLVVCSVNKKSNVIVEVDNTIRQTKNNATSFSFQLPTDEIGEHYVKVYVEGQEEFARTISYMVNVRFITVSVDLPDILTVITGDDLHATGSASDLCTVIVEVDDNKHQTIKDATAFTINLPTDVIGNHSVKVYVAGQTNGAKTFSYKVEKKPDTPATGNTSVPSVPGSEINNGIPNSSYAPNVNGQNVNSEYNSGGNTPSVKGQNLDQYYNGGGSTPDIKGTNL